MKITIFEIIKMIKDGKLKDGTKIRCSDFPATYVYKNGTLGFYSAEEFIELTLKDILENINYANYEILEEEPRDIEVCGSWFTKSEYDKLFCCEEEKKIPEKLDIKDIYSCDDCQQIHINFKYTWNKINEIIDYLKSKGDK